MGLGLLGTAVAGAFEGAGTIAYQEVKAQIELDKQKALEEARAANQERLVRLQDTLKRAPAKEAMAKAEDLNKPVMVDDGQGSGNLQTPPVAEQRANTRKALLESGDPSLIGAASSMENTDVMREGQASRERQTSQQIASNEKIAAASDALRNISIGIEGGRLKLEQSRAAIDDSIKTIQYENAQRVKDLQDEFQSPDATPERKSQIKDQIQLLTGKDNDKYVPVATGYDEMTGKPTGYKIFNRADNTWSDPPGTNNSKPQWNPKTKEIRVDGKVIGTADNAADATTKAKAYTASSGSASASDTSPVNAQAVTVPGRPLYNTGQKELARLAARPKGVSPAQAQEAQDEIDRRKGESRISGG
ncbi:MAG: hypothetical protein M0Z99_32060 [Betaproteobacteria bacterium]|nr:hypothetical protein [Betaproteobacteria bacterium]